MSKISRGAGPNSRARRLLAASNSWLAGLKSGGSSNVACSGRLKVGKEAGFNRSASTSDKKSLNGMQMGVVEEAVCHQVPAVRAAAEKTVKA